MFRRLSSCLNALAVAFSCLLPGQAKAADRLPALGADSSQVSVSGLSAGAFMAVQYAVAYSKSVIGAGIIAGGPYYCAAGNPLNIGVCMGQSMWGGPNPAFMAQFAHDFGESGAIDPLVNLQREKIYVFSGNDDMVVRQPAVDATVEFFRQLGVPAANLTYVNTVAAGHAFISPLQSTTNACSANASPYVSHCKVGNEPYDQAGALLAFIYEGIRPPAGSLTGSPTDSLTGSLITFDQTEFAGTFAAMSSEGIAYVPQYCSQNPGCRIHVVFHGCLQSAEQVRKNTTYDNWADQNRIVVVYPQVSGSSAPSGCWDWYGYTGADYAWKTGQQLQAVRAMVNRLTSRR
ncbi:PHB depolymerase family esterase [Paraburkholderia sabiae]|nr:hypothetical protein LMG24235_00919 [Paraburkholderia sabiae]